MVTVTVLECYYFILYMSRCVIMTNSIEMHTRTRIFIHVNIFATKGLKKITWFRASVLRVTYENIFPLIGEVL